MLEVIKWKFISNTQVYCLPGTVPTTVKNQTSNPSRSKDTAVYAANFYKFSTLARESKPYTDKGKKGTQIFWE